MVDGLDVVAVGIEHESRVVAGVVSPLARAAVVAPAGGEGRVVEALHRVLVRGLEREVEPACRLAVAAHEQLVGGEPVVAAAHLDPERRESSLVEAPARFEIGDANVHVVEQPS